MVMGIRCGVGESCQSELEKEGKIMIPIAGANCIYFEPSDSGGTCKHPDMKHGFWIFSCREGCVITRKEKIKCKLRKPKIEPITEIIKMSKPKSKPKRKAPHIHKKHIHKKEK